MSDNHQKVMDKAYDRWQQNVSMSKEDFWATLTPAERFAVFTGNLNYQVCNGGFLQWGMQGNAYGTPEVVQYLVAELRAMGTEASLKVRKLLLEYMAAQEDFENEGDFVDEDEEEWARYVVAIEPLDDQYYAINDAFMVDCENYLNSNFKF